MAVRQIQPTDTLETFRTEFNNLNSQDFGDIANLSGAISSTNLVEVGISATEKYLPVSAGTELGKYFLKN